MPTGRVGSPDESLDPGGFPAPSEPRPAAAIASSPPRRGAAASILIGLGIFLTRVFGLVRTRAMSSYLGVTDASDAFTAALRIPNFLQNLFGEGALSASFIPIYARLVAEGRQSEAERVAGAVLGILAAGVTALAAAGVLAAPVLVDLLADGFDGAKRELTIALVRVMFPGIALLVLSAWCLGILNSHRKFFLSYAAPIAWNLAIIAGLVWEAEVAGRRGDALVRAVAWWTTAGCALQFAVQLPAVVRLGRYRPSLAWTNPQVREVTRNFGPAFVSRGAVQIGAFIDLRFASYLGTGAQSVMGYAQQIYLLPIGLFGMAISAAQLTEMSSEIGDPDRVHQAIRTQLATNVRRIVFFVVPSAVAFVALGDVVAGVILQAGAFRREDSVSVWIVLAGSAIGLVASTLGRLYSSTFYALRDTRTPLNVALFRIALSIALGWTLAFPVRRALSLDGVWGAAGLTAAAGVAGWVEYALLRARLHRRLGLAPASVGHGARVWTGASLAAAAAWGLKTAIDAGNPLTDGAAILGVYGLVYLAATRVLGVPEAQALLHGVGRRLWRRA